MAIYGKEFAAACNDNWAFWDFMTVRISSGMASRDIRGFSAPSSWKQVMASLLGNVNDHEPCPTFAVHTHSLRSALGINHL